MARELSVDEVRELLGAYALDAVDDDDERAAVEALLARDPRARVEVSEFRETAALLAQGGGEAPPGLWLRVEESLEGSAPPPAPRPAPPLVLPRDRGRDRGRRRRLRVATAIGIAAAVAAFVALGVKVIDQDRRLDEVAAPTVSDLAEAASDHAEARRVVLASEDGQTRAEIVWLPDGTGYLVDDNLTALPLERTYQLWAVAGDGSGATTTISAGVLGPDPKVTSFRFDGPVETFVVTEEDAPGVPTSDNPALLAGSVT